MRATRIPSLWRRTAPESSIWSRREAGSKPFILEMCIRDRRRTMRIMEARNPLARPKMTSVPHSSNSSDLDFIISPAARLATPSVEDAVAAVAVNGFVAAQHLHAGVVSNDHVRCV